MLVGVMSDTHDNTSFLPRIAREFEKVGVELVIHLGDYIAPFTLEKILSSIDARFIGVMGNNDGEKPGLIEACKRHNCTLHDSMAEIELGKARALAFHGFGPPSLTDKIALSLALSKSWDIILYGHTHKPVVSYVRGVLVLNPGTAGGALNSPSIAILDTERMRPELVALK